MSAAAVVTPPPAALSDSKIVLRVLSLLKRRDLQKGASSVCREWYILARGLLYPTGLYWIGKVPLTQQYILEDLHGIQTLPAITSTSAHFYIRPMCTSDESYTSAGQWGQLQTQIRKLLVKDPESHFQEVVVSGGLDVKVEALEPVRIFSTSLTSVRIENIWMETVTVAVILESCPLLLQLEIESTFRRPIITDGSQATQPGVQRRADTDKSMPAEILMPKRQFDTTITQLSLSGIRIELQSLERLLFSCRKRPNSTGLLDLTLRHVMIQRPLSTPGTEPGTEPETSPDQQTLSSIHRWCPSLRSLHFSMMDTTLSQQDQAQLFKQFADVPSWGIPHSDILPSTFLSLQAYVNHVTTLMLTCSCGGLAPLVLHEYLCNSPQLRNLAIDNILYPAEYMDLEPVALNRDGYYSPRYCQDESSTLEASKSKAVDPTSLTLWLQRRVWACRGLETLQIKVDGLVGDTRAARNSRVMFAYLALVCPHLRELRITRDKMNLQLEGGLCYLGALEDLQVLILQTTHIQVKHVSDIGWMRQSSASASAAAAGSRTRKTMGSLTGSNRISRLNSGISRATTRSTLVSRRSLPFHRSKTWMSGDKAQKGLWSRVVGRIFESGGPRLFRLKGGSTGIARTRTISAQDRDLGREGGHSRSDDEKKILQGLAAMYKAEGVSKAVDRMERRKVRAEGSGGEDDEVGYCWPDMELFVLDAAKYSGISSEALMTTMGGFRTDILFQALSLNPWHATA
ncbi:hypothetical protein BGZ72_009075 [Mortierella alpina]|nr:hypothetical protein BGZ72_009075 [Mortierella alpina]